MKIAESIYKGVVEPSYKKPTRADANRAGRSRNKIGEDSSSNNHPVMGESAGKRRKRYVYRLKSESRTCIIQGPGHSYVEC